MDKPSKPAGNSQTTNSELEKFQLFYEFVPVSKSTGRVKRSNSSDSSK